MKNISFIESDILIENLTLNETSIESNFLMSIINSFSIF